LHAGDNFVIAIDDLGIVYEWGRGKNKPEETQDVTQRVIDISAGGEQKVYVLAKGTVVGKGDILEGEIAGITNAIKTAVTNDKIIILTGDRKNI